MQQRPLSAGTCATIDTIEYRPIDSCVSSAPNTLRFALLINCDATRTFLVGSAAWLKRIRL